MGKIIDSIHIKIYIGKLLLDFALGCSTGDYYIDVTMYFRGSFTKVRKLRWATGKSTGGCRDS